MYTIQVHSRFFHSIVKSSTAGDGLAGGSTAVDVNISTTNQNLVGRIRERLSHGKVEISPSAYDTAWVAMVPAREHSGGGKRTGFPQCLDWIVDNQNPDGSWGLDPGHPSLVQDALSNTLACVLALRKWDTGHRFVQKGLSFIESNAWAATGNIHEFSPMGFTVIFPAMVKLALELDLALPLNPNLVDSLLHIRDSEIRRNKDLEYFSEGLGELCNWEQVLMHQRSNGSLFNSPSTTAAALIHQHDDKCYQYLDSVLKSFDGWVPAIYPMDMYARLYLVDTLERLGVYRHFFFEISPILDEIYRCWQEKDNEIFDDVNCLAMAFRLLRKKGFDVSSDELAELVEEEQCFNKSGLTNASVATTVLELYRASQMKIHEEEAILEKIHAWTSIFLKQQLLNQSIIDKRLHKQVEYDLRNFHGTLDRVGIKRSIELYDCSDLKILKTAFRCLSIKNEDIIRFSVEDFNAPQVQYQKELKQMESWYNECRLDQLNQGRNVLHVSFLFISATLAEPHLSMARLSYAQVVVLVTCLDDFFDHYGSKEEILSLVELVRNWKKQSDTTYCSNEVEILFTALYDTVTEVAEKAYTEQGYHIKDDLVDMWLELLTIFMREMEYSSALTLDEYLSYAWKSISCNLCILTAMQFLGTKLSAKVFTSEETMELCKQTSYVCWLLNDLKSFKRELKQGKLNGVTVQTVNEGVPEDAAVLKLQEIVEQSRRKVLGMVYQNKESMFSQECRELFWKTCKIAHCLYSHDGGDEFSSPQMIFKDLNAVVWEPLQLPLAKSTV